MTTIYIIQYVWPLCRYTRIHILHRNQTYAVASAITMTHSVLQWLFLKQGSVSFLLANCSKHNLNLSTNIKPVTAGVDATYTIYMLEYLHRGVGYQPKLRIQQNTLLNWIKKGSTIITNKAKGNTTMTFTNVFQGKSITVLDILHWKMPVYNHGSCKNFSVTK